MPALDATLAEKIASLADMHRLRAPVATQRGANARVQRDGHELISFSCNDYLGLSQHPEVLAASQAALTQYGAGAGASRLITGNHPLYAQLEQSLAEYKHTEAACVFGSGYMANIGAITALMGCADLIVADKLIHACILDGMKLSSAKLLRFAHNDAAECARILKKHRPQHANCLVITETIFSMDGDTAPLAELRELCNTHDAWLMTDDAHGFGLPQTVQADIQMGTLSKAMGAYGGYVCGSATLVEYLKTCARSLIYTTGLPPATVAAALAGVHIMQSEPQRCKRPLELAQRFTKSLALPLAQSAIVPIILGKETAALQAATKLEEAGFLVSAIRPPTVPDGSSRLRFAFSAAHNDSDVNNLIESIRNAGIST